MRFLLLRSIKLIVKCTGGGGGNTAAGGEKQPISDADIAKQVTDVCPELDEGR